MNSSKRRETVLQLIKESESPISASALANMTQVSRQLIVGDVALLRAQGHKIIATPRGYLSDDEVERGITKTLAIIHEPEEILDEFYTIVDLGGTIKDVIVEHPVYGQIVAQLHVSNRYEADQFYQKIQQMHAKPLSNLTNGLHLHTISCPNEECYQRIEQALGQKGYLYNK